MVKITKSAKQYRITIPNEIMELTQWDEDTELIFIPNIKTPEDELTIKTPIFLRRVNKK